MTSFKTARLESADDEVALEKAKQLVGHHHAELWQYAGKIATLDHQPQRIFRASPSS
jgi:hypothetical protein